MLARLRRSRGDAGFTLVELLVASAMGVVVMGAVASLVISALRDQPKISQQAQNITTARWVLERLTHEIRNGVDASAKPIPAKSPSRPTCDIPPAASTADLPSASPAIKCQVTYACTTTACSRTEAAPGIYTGTPRPIFSGINSSQVFTYAPNTTEATYVKATLSLPNPSGTGALTVSDGASLRNATLGY